MPICLHSCGYPPSRGANDCICHMAEATEAASRWTKAYTYAGLVGPQLGQGLYSRLLQAWRRTQVSCVPLPLQHTASRTYVPHTPYDRRTWSRGKALLVACLM